MGDCADAYEPAICGFLLDGITLIWSVFLAFSSCSIWCVRKRLPKMDGMDTVNMDQTGLNSLSVTSSLKTGVTSCFQNTFFIFK